MGEDNFLKQASGFIIAFFLGSATLHGLLYFLVTDADDLFYGSKVPLFPLVAFLLLYSLIPLLTVTIWRYRFVSKTLLQFYEFQKEDDKKPPLVLLDEYKDVDKNQKDPDIKAFKSFEYSLMAMLWLSMLLFNLYMGLWLFGNWKEELLYNLTFIFGIVSIIPIGFMLVRLSRIKYKYEDPKKNTANDELSIEKKKAFRTEFIMLCIGWLVLLFFVGISFNERVDWGKKELGQDSIYPAVDSIRDTLANQKALLANAKYLSSQLDDLEEKFIQTNFYTDLIDSNNFEDLFSAYNEKSKLWHDTVKKHTLSSSDSCKDCDTLKAQTNSAFKRLSKKLDTNVNRNAIADFNFWLSISKNKTTHLKKVHEGGIIDGLTPILIKAQNFFLIQLMLILLLTLMYWYISNMAYVDILRVDNTEKTPEPLSEIDISKALLVLVFVFLVPILKPIQREDIQFNHPLWTVNMASITEPNISGNYDPKPAIPNGPPISITYRTDTTISTPRLDSSTLDSIKLEINTIKTLLEQTEAIDFSEKLDTISNKVSRINKKLNTDWPESKSYSKQLKDIEAKVKAIENELNKTKRR